jgi:hypothetical protein
MIQVRAYLFDRRHWRVLLAIAAVALSLRLLPLLRPGDTWTVLDDSNEYLALVRGMRAGCGFARLSGSACRPPELLRLPGYPLFVAIMPNLRTVVAAQALLGATTALVIGAFSCARWGPAAGLIAEALLAQDIPSIVASSTVMSDCLFQAVLVVAILLQLSALARRSTGRNAVALALLAAIFLAFGVLLRGVAIVLPLLAALPFWWMPNITIAKRVALSVIATAIPLTAMLAWTARNYALTGRWTFTTEGAYTLYYYNTAGVLWFVKGGELTEQQTELSRAIGANGPDEFITAAQQHQMLHRSLSVFSSHPVATLTMLLRCFAWLAIVPDRANLNALLRSHARSSVFLIASQNPAKRIRETLRSPPLAAFVALQVPFILFTWIGVFLTLLRLPARFPDQRPLILIPLAVAFLMMLAGTGPGAIARFRLPAMPFLAMLTGIGWSEALDRRVAARRGRESATIFADFVRRRA